MQIFFKLIRCAQLSNFYRSYSQRVQLNKCISLNVIGSGAIGESPSVCLSTSNNESVLFNCTEDCQRLLTEHRIKIATIKHIFVTQTKWDCIGGISGVGRTIRNANGWLPMLHGPKQLYKCIKRILCLSILSELDFQPMDCNFDRFFENDDLKIKIVSIKRNGQHKNIRDEHEVLVFIGEVKAKPTVDSKARPHFMIIDLPTKEHVSSFLDSQFFRTTKKALDIVVHFTPEDVVSSQGYQRLVSNLTAKKHLFLNASNEFSCLRSVYQLQEKLNRIDKEIHPPLRMPLLLSSKSCDLTQFTGNIENRSEFFTKYYLANGGSPNKNAEKHKDDKLALCQPKFRQSVDIDRLKTYPKIVFLGTVSATASAERNHTSILIDTAWNQSMLLDCGEGTCSQIARLYGKHGAATVIRRIRAVFVSHLHYDHFGGLVELLRLRKLLLPPDRSPLILLAPKADLKSWLFFYDNTIEAIHDDLFFIDNDNLMTGGLGQAICKQLGLQALRTCRVPHFNRSYAVSLANGPNGHEPFKITFSSDTGPCADLISLGQNSQLLIHEATYPDECVDRAAQHRHSTVAQAIAQSQKMNAKYTILTHFSKRYEYPQIDSIQHKNISIAFDFMELTANDLPKLNSIQKQYRNFSIKNR